MGASYCSAVCDRTMRMLIQSSRGWHCPLVRYGKAGGWRHLGNRFAIPAFPQRRRRLSTGHRISAHSTLRLIQTRLREAGLGCQEKLPRRARARVFSLDIPLYRTQLLLALPSVYLCTGFADRLIAGISRVTGKRVLLLTQFRLRFRGEPTRTALRRCWSLRTAGHRANR
jgi:hypothetical protein